MPERERRRREEKKKRKMKHYSNFQNSGDLLNRSAMEFGTIEFERDFFIGEISGNNSFVIGLVFLSYHEVNNDDIFARIGE